VNAQRATDPADRGDRGDAGGGGTTKLRITQVRSVIGRPKDQRDTIRSLGLRRIRDSVLRPDRPEVRGMVRKVAHLVTVEEVSQ
jgi:large subunit ribosomal protein L30